MQHHRRSIDLLWVMFPILDPWQEFYFLKDKVARATASG